MKAFIKADKVETWPATEKIGQLVYSIVFNKQDKCFYACNTECHNILKITSEGDISPFASFYKDEPKSIDYYQNGKYFIVALFQSHKVMKVSLQVEMGEMASKTQGNIINPRGVTINQQTGDAYILTNKNGIYKISLSGEISVILNPRHVHNSYKGIILDEDIDSLLVTDCDNNKIFIVTMNGKVSALCDIKRPDQIVKIAPHEFLVTSFRGRKIYHVSRVYENYYQVTDFAGDGNFSRIIDGNAEVCSFVHPVGISYDDLNCVCIVGDFECLRKITLSSSNAINSTVATTNTTSKNIKPPSTVPKPHYGTIRPPLIHHSKPVYFSSLLNGNDRPSSSVPSTHNFTLSTSASSTSSLKKSKPLPAIPLCTSSSYNNSNNNNNNNNNSNNNNSNNNNSNNNNSNNNNSNNYNSNNNSSNNNNSNNNSNIFNINNNNNIYNINNIFNINNFNVNNVNNSNTNNFDTAYLHLIIKMKDITLINIIGEGSQGIIYRADWKGNPVVYKQRKQMRGNDRQEFMKEFSVWQHATHESCVALYGIVDEENEFGFVAEYCFEGNLLFKQKVVLGVMQTIDFACDLANAVNTLHAKRISHRDIKSANIMITHDFKSKLGDFGSSKLLNTIVSGSTFVGSLLYMAPEVYEVIGGDPLLSDVYSFGILMYELATSTVVTTRKLVEVENKPEGFSKEERDMWWNLVRNCIQHDPSLRPPMHEVMSKLHVLKKKIQDFKCKKHGKSSHQVFISYRVDTDKDIKNNHLFIALN